MFVVAAAMFGLMAVLATLQYRWLGQVRRAERERMGAMLNTRASAFAQDFDRELARAYLLFQTDGAPDAGSSAARLAARYDRWHATSRFPRLIGSIYLIEAADGKTTIERFNLATRFVEPAEWPESLEPLQSQLSRHDDVPANNGTFVIRPALSPVLENVPAIVVPTPVIFFDQGAEVKLHLAPVRIPARMSYTVLVLDRDYLVNEMLPSMAEQHFKDAGEGFDYQLAVVHSGDSGVVYRSTAEFEPAAGVKADAAADLFQVRTQDFGALAAEVRRFSTFVTQRAAPAGAGSESRSAVIREMIRVPAHGPAAPATPPGAQVSIVLQPGGLSAAQKNALTTGVAASTSLPRTPPAPKWKLLVKHPSGSLEAAVRATQRRNALVSSGILAVLGASMALLVLSTRRAQRLATQQMEFVAAVSHELRTPLAVIRSAGDNLADGVVRSDEQIRRYGDLVRNEGRRLTEMVEQILEFAGIHSGQRGLALRPVPMRALLDDIVDASRTLIDEAGIDVEMDVPETLPPALGDEVALRRVFQNLVANAVKYGARGGWIGLRGRAAGREVQISVCDRGIGIAAAEQSRIFEPFYRTPDVIAAQIQGAGLGLSLVKRIVEGHGGRISVRSAPGEGSEFTVHLPIASEEPIGATDAEGSTHGATHAATARS